MYFRQLEAWIHCLNKVNVQLIGITVFLSRFGTFLRSELKFSKLLFSSHHSVTCAHQKSSFSFLWTSCKCFGTSMQMIMYNSLLFPTSSIAYVMLIKMYYNWSLLNSLIPHNIYALVHRLSLYMQNRWTNCHNVTHLSLHFHYAFFLNLSWIGKLLPGESWLSLTKGNVWSIRSTNDQPVFWNSSKVHFMNHQMASIYI